MRQHTIVQVLGYLMALSLPRVALAMSEDERVLRAVQPNIAELRKCYLEAAERYAIGTCEPATVIVDAAYAACAEELRNVSTELHKVAPYTQAVDDPFVTGVRDGARPLILKRVLDVRLAHHKCLPR